MLVSGIQEVEFGLKFATPNDTKQTCVLELDQRFLRPFVTSP